MANIRSIYRSKVSANPLAYIPSVSHSNLKKLFYIIGKLDYKIPVWHSVEDAVLYAVIGQMLSISAAESIIRRLLHKFGTSKKVIQWASRSASRTGPINGVSHRKRKALSEWCSYAKARGRFRQRWQKMSLEDYRAEICAIWGFGRWASDMLAIFYVGRDDVWPVSDAGINRACRIIFGTNDFKKIHPHIEGNETICALYLWEFLNKRLKKI